MELNGAQTVTPFMKRSIYGYLENAAESTLITWALWCLLPPNEHSTAYSIKTFLLRNTQRDKMTDHSRCVSDVLKATRGFHWEGCFMNSDPFGTHF